mmetsp:Transcript_41386/g.105857  ORF Transcript_41386/g.105857 Transcript_41386/m.105857 type:complete len:465 (+) Transcript_41386:144-1538(+)
MATACAGELACRPAAALSPLPRRGGRGDATPSPMPARQAPSRWRQLRRRTPLSWAPMVTAASRRQVIVRMASAEAGGAGAVEGNDPAPCSVERSAAFSKLAGAAGVTMDLQLLSSGPPRNSGLFSSVEAARGQVLMEVPRAACLTVDYVAGLSLPSEGQWPNLIEGLNRDEPLPWDLLLALALVDAKMGEGGAFWGEYVASVLPGEEELSVPFCLPPGVLPEFQHAALQAGAEAQRERLAALFPGLASPRATGGLPPLLRTYALVRSRAFRASEDSFAFVPFLDAANHAPDPNADFRRDDAGVWQLVALRDIAVGEEVCISYTGEEGYTNRRLMAQYGFVPSEGNPADRIDLEEDLGLSAEQLAGKQLSGSKLEAAVGPDLASMASGQNVYLFSTIRSLPLVDDEQQPLTGTEQFAELLLEKCKHALEGKPSPSPTPSMAGTIAGLTTTVQRLVYGRHDLHACG